jgi:hypothetical protein
MTDDITEALAVLDLLEVPKLDRDVRRRSDEPRGREIPHGRPAGRRILAAAVALAVFGAAGVFAWTRLRPVEETRAPRGAWEGYPVGWTELPVPPEARDSASWVWTGDEVLMWAGCVPRGETCDPRMDGFSFDPQTGAWSAIPAAPGPSATDAQGVWTGREAIFIGTFAGTGGAQLAGVGYTPSTRSWRVLPVAPIGSAHGNIVVWTGSEVFVWGGGERDDPRGHQGALYDPAADRWRRTADAPIGLNLATGIWTGREVVVVGSWLNGRNIAGTETTVGAAYDPATDRWRELPASALSPQATAAAWLDGRVVAYDYEPDFQVYDLVADRWSDAAPMPFRFDECYPDAVSVGELVLAFFCGRAATFDGAKWQHVGGGPLDERIDAGARSYALYRFATIVPTGSALVFDVTGITVVGKDDTPCYGCPGAPRALWVWRPPAG